MNSWLKLYNILNQCLSSIYCVQINNRKNQIYLSKDVYIFIVLILDYCLIALLFKIDGLLILYLIYLLTDLRMQLQAV